MFHPFLQNKIVLKLLLGSFIWALLSSCQDKDTQSFVSKQTHSRKILEISPEETLLFRSTPGQVLSQKKSLISSRIMGYITKLNVSEGDLVKKGDLLATIDPIDVQSQLEIAKASQEQAQAALSDAQVDFERFDRLLAEKAITTTQWEKMKLNYQMAQQRSIQASSGLNMAKAQTKYTHIRSPISGVISRKALQVGDLVSPGIPFLTVENPHQLEILTQVPEALYQKIQWENKVCFYENQKQICDLTIHNKVPVADPISHTHLLKLNLGDESAQALHPGSFIEVYFPIATEKNISIPQKSILVRAGLKGVFIVNDKQEAQFRMIRTTTIHGQEAAERVLVQSGLKEGDKVLFGDLSSIQNSDQIHILNP